VRERERERDERERIALIIQFLMPQPFVFSSVDLEMLNSTSVTLLDIFLQFANR
jgi:hypothetical protein